MIKTTPEYYEYNNELWRCSVKDVIEAAKGKIVYLYGAGKYGQFLLHQLREKGITVAGFFVTQLKNKQEECIEGLKVLPVAKAKEELTDQDYIIVVCNENSADEMLQILRDYGLFSCMKMKVHQIRRTVDVEEQLWKQEQNRASLKDGLLRIRITHKCPGKCDFCGQKNWSKDYQNLDMPSEWYFEYMKPLYEEIKVVLLTGGDSFFAKDSYAYIRFLSEKYPHISIMTESNGMMFTEKFQELAVENLMLPHISLNASTAEYFEKGCWSSEGAKEVYSFILRNIENYIEKLKSKSRLCFAPNYSMVINSKNAEDVLDFVKLSLKLYGTYITFYFDYQENDMNGNYFSNPEPMRKALRTLMELELVMQDKVFLGFRLWTPLKELAMMKETIANVTIEELNEKYAEIIGMIKDRSIIRENLERNQIRRTAGKKELTLEEDTSFTLQSFTIQGEKTCKAPWQVLDIYPDGRLDFCSWHEPTLYLPDYITEHGVQWNEILNSREFCSYRHKMLQGDYTGCMSCCPVRRECENA